MRLNFKIESADGMFSVKGKKKRARDIDRILRAMRKAGK
jgi:hypothetical protein